MPKRVSKYPVVRTKPWPKILDYRKSQLKCYMVDGRQRGNGRRYYFRKLTDARTCADQLAAEWANHGVVTLSLSSAEKSVMADCAIKLRPFGKTIWDASIIRRARRLR